MFRHTRILLIALAFMGGVAFHLPRFASLQAADSDSAIPWGHDLNAALAEASQSGRPVLLHFYSDHCVPCKMLEARAFKNAEVGDAITRSVIPVKIHYDQNREIAQHYVVTRFPTDLFLHPNGEELYRTVSPQDPSDYVRLIERVSMKNRDWVVERMSRHSTHASNDRGGANPRHTADANLEQRPVATQSPLFQSAPSGKPVQPQPNQFCAGPECDGEMQSLDSREAPSGPFHLASQATEIRENRYQRQGGKESNGPSSPTPIESTGNAAEPMAAVTMRGIFADDPSLGLEGYCPVALSMQSAWVPGQDAFSVKHRGRIYRCASEEARTLFLQDPDRYSPVLSGYDVVHFLETGELIAGQRRYGWFSNGRVFVFMSEANKARFKQFDQHYTQSIQAHASKDRVANEVSSDTLRR